MRSPFTTESRLWPVRVGAPNLQYLNIIDDGILLVVEGISQVLVYLVLLKVTDVLCKRENVTRKGSPYSGP